MKKLICILLFVLKAEASFENTSYRYLMPGDFYNKLLMIFPNADRISETMYSQSSSGEKIYLPLISYQCPRESGLQNDILVDFGTTSPITGEPSVSSPDISMVNKLATCGALIIKFELSVFESRPNTRIIIESDHSSINEMARDTLSRIFPNYKNLYTKDQELMYRVLDSYIDFKDPVVWAHTVHLVHMMLGPDNVISEYGQAKNADEITSTLITDFLASGKTTTLKDYTIKVLTNLIIREEFLAY